MAFQDFDQITERRRSSNEQKFKRRVLIAVASGVALLAIIGAGVFAVATRLGHHKPAAPPPEDHGEKINKVVRFICNATDYKDRCESVLSRAEGSGSPRELLVAAISEGRSELHKAFGKTRSWKFASEAERGAFEDCEGLVEDALEELEKSARSAGKGSLSAKKPQLDSWLSAVISYQQTCIDGFPEGKMKKDMTKLFKASKEFASNSLALVSELSSLLSAFQMSGVPVRRLLEVAAESSPSPAPAPAPKLPAEIVHLPAAAGVPAPNSSAAAPVLAAVPVKAPTPTPTEVPVKVPAPTATEVPVKSPVPTPVPGSTGSLEDLGFPDWMEEDDRKILRVPGEKPTPNVTVAKDGSGQFKTINEALLGLPLKYDGRYVIYVKEGIYDETVILTKKMWNVTMYGDGAQKSIITGNKNFVDGVRTFLTATFGALGDGFIGIGMGFRNTAGPEKHQAVAARVQGDRVVFFNCRFEGYQDTLYTQAHRQLYRSCVVSGTVDFIFGDAAVVFQNCLIAVRRPLDNQQNIVTAQGRIDRMQTTGIVLQHCRIIADRTLEPVQARFRSYLGRPWKEFSRTVVMETAIHSVIHPDGWLPWEKEFALNTLFYAEYANSGPGAALDKRIRWLGYKGLIAREMADQFTVRNFLQTDWLDAALNKAVPFRPTLYDS